MKKSILEQRIIFTCVITIFFLLQELLIEYPIQILIFIKKVLRTLEPKLEIKSCIIGRGNYAIIK